MQVGQGRVGRRGGDQRVLQARGAIEDPPVVPGLAAEQLARVGLRHRVGEPAPLRYRHRLVVARDRLVARLLEQLRLAAGRRREHGRPAHAGPLGERLDGRGGVTHLGEQLRGCGHQSLVGAASPVGTPRVADRVRRFDGHEPILHN